MEKIFKLCLILILSSFAVPPQVLGSRPINYQMTGCVMDGMLFSLRKGVFKVGAPPEMRANYSRVIPPTVNLAPYEGKKIRVRGFLNPGNVFQPDLKSLEVLGVCDEEARLAIQHELPQAFRSKAEEKARQGDWDHAGRYIDKAIKLDKASCSLYLTRATFYQEQGKFAEAAKDAERAVQLGCKRYPDLAFLAGLLEKVGRKSAAIGAYEQAMAVCEYKPDRERFQQEINRLQGSARTLPQEGRTQVQTPPPGTTNGEALPPPPPLPE